MRKLFNDDNGFVISAELVLVMTIGVLSMVVGLSSVSHSITNELCDVASAFGTIDQTFNYRGVKKDIDDCGTHPWHGKTAGAGFNDKIDTCDCVNVTFPEVCGKNQSSGNNEQDD